MRALMLAAALAAASACTKAPANPQWFLTTEQALMDATATGDKPVWDRVMDPTCIVTTEEGELLTKAQFLDELRALPPGLSGHIKVTDLSVQDLQSFAIVRYLADESESVFGQQLHVQYRVTNTYKPNGTSWTMVSSHLSVITRDPPAQEVSHADWPGLVGKYKLQPDGWTFIVEMKDGQLMGGRDPAKLRPLIPLTPHAFVVTGQLGEWLFVVEKGKATKILNLRKFAPLVWERVPATPSAESPAPSLGL